jgi:hypothetical protein
MEVYKSVSSNVPFLGQGQLTNSTAVKRMESAREKIMHQNFQSLVGDTAREASSGGLAEDGDKGDIG